MSGIVGIGSAVYDFLIRLDHFPTEDTKQETQETKSQCGGPCAVALIAASRLGCGASYLGTVGGDRYGAQMLRAFEACGVDVSRVRTAPGSVSFHSFVLLSGANASRTCLWNRGSVPPPSADDIDPDVLRQADFLHLDGHQTQAALHAAQLAHAYGVPVSLDAGGMYPGMEALLPLADVLIPSEEFALQATGAASAEDAAARLYAQYRPQTLVITQGSRGGFLWEDGKPRRYPAFAVTAIDSNGAGDTFHGAFLAARTMGRGDYDAAVFASAASALKCTRFGAQDGIPNREAVLAFLKERT